MQFHRNKSVDVHQFAMVPRSEIPRSKFRMQKTYKSTFNEAGLVPIMVEEVLPGDTFNVRATMFARMATPIFPLMDNMYLESFFFFVPNRLVWANWVKFMGEQDNPADSIAFTIPQNVSPVGGYAVNSIYDYMGLPTLGQVGGANTVSHSSLPLRAYTRIWNDWFRDENLEAKAYSPTNDGPDAFVANIGPVAVFSRYKRRDYFTGCLPWTQKGGVAVSIPLGTSAPVKTNATALVTGAQTGMLLNTTAGGVPASTGLGTDAGNHIGTYATFAPSGAFVQVYPSNLFADLSTATAATINQLRQSFQIQKLLEKDARAGSRYTEIVRSHFGVVSPDARLQRPEFLGGGSQPINVSAIAQTTATGLTGGTSPLGTLSAFATVTAHGHGFSQSFTEHGYIIGIINVRADLTYQQGLRRHWSRSTRYDYYFPVFAMLGEQAVLNKEIFCDGSANDALVFGYQERWAEYRYNPSEITGLFRSTAAGTLDSWHLSQKFAALPVLNTAFSVENPPFSRVVAVPSQPRFILDAFFDMNVARPLPMYSVPGLIDHF